MGYKPVNPIMTFQSEHKMKTFFALLITIATIPFAKAETAGDVVVRACDDRTPTSVEYFVEQTSFAQGSVRLFNMDTYGEPVCCSSHLVIYLPEQEPFASRCFHVAASAEGLGFVGLNLKNIKASYDSKTGLALQVPFGFYTEEGTSKYKVHTLLINQKNLTVIVK